MRKIIYFDNIENCHPRKQVIKFVKKNIGKLYGNPNSLNFIGSNAKAQIEQSRNTIAYLLKVPASQIRFTSGGTESNNLACNYINKNNTKAIITSKYEHSSVLKTLEKKSIELNIPIYFVEHDTETGIDLKKLNLLLEQNTNSFVSLSHLNVLSGRLLQIKRVSALCHKYNSVFHSDLSHTIGKFNINLQTMGIDIATASAENFGGIVGAGIIYFEKEIKLAPLFFGNENEYNLRPGKLNIATISAMALALEIEYKYFEINKNHYLSLKKYLFESLDKKKIKYNRFSSSEEHFVTFINLLSFPKITNFKTFLIKLDINNIMLFKIEKEKINEKSYIHISFNSQNTKKDIRKFVRILKMLL